MAVAHLTNDPYAYMLPALLPLLLAASAARGDIELR